jgi:hypothetical protein
MTDTSDKTYTVEIRDVYGKTIVYPVCDTAHTFAASFHLS